MAKTIRITGPITSLCAPPDETWIDEPEETYCPECGRSVEAKTNCVCIDLDLEELD